jgi:hypothetical protein
MTKSEFKERLDTEVIQMFIYYKGTANHKDGWKLSIQGKTVEDAAELYDRLISLLMITKCSFKFGTKRFINYDDSLQSNKLLTVYIPNGVDPKSFAELVYLHLENYNGHEGLGQPNSYTHYKGPIYYRNDRDEDGHYISANEELNENNEKE